MKIYDMEHHYLSQAYYYYIIEQGEKPEEISGQLHAEFGFGADFPYENCKRSVDFILNMDISDEDKEKICYKNTEKYILKI